MKLYIYGWIVSHSSLKLVFIGEKKLSFIPLKFRHFEFNGYHHYYMPRESWYIQGLPVSQFLFSLHSWPFVYLQTEFTHDVSALECSLKCVIFPTASATLTVDKIDVNSRVGLLHNLFAHNFYSARWWWHHIVVCFASVLLYSPVVSWFNRNFITSLWAAGIFALPTFCVGFFYCWSAFTHFDMCSVFKTVLSLDCLFCYSFMGFITCWTCNEYFNPLKYFHDTTIKI